MSFTIFIDVIMAEEISCKTDIEVVLNKAKEIIATDKWWFEQLEKGCDPTDIEKEKELP